MGDNTVVVSVCIIYFAVMVGIGMIAARKNKETSDYLVAGRKLNVTMTAITLAAVQIGVGIVLSSATNGYNEGVWPGMYYAFGCGGGLIIAGLVTTKKLREEEGYVPLDYFAQRYGDSKGIRLWAWISNVPSLLGIFIAQLLASGGILAGFGIPFKTGVIITAVVILIYCTVGGMWGVVLTDVVQTAIIAVGVPILAIAILVQYVQAGGNVGAIFSTPFIPKGMGTKFVYLVLPFLLSISVSYDAYSRIQSAKDAKTARIGCIVGGILVIIIGGLCSTIGVAARTLFPGVTDGIFTIAATGVLPPVLAGIVIAAILAAAMSSANCVILSMGSLVGIFFAFHMTDILDAMIIFNYPYMGSLLIPLLGGLVWKGATRKGAFAAAIAGGIVGVVSFLFGIPGPLYGKMNTDLSLLIAYVISAVFLVVFSLIDRSRAKK